MSSSERSLIGSVFERSTPRAPSAPSRFNGLPGTGFPIAQHRFKSAFARAREEANSKGNSNRADLPSVVPGRSKRRTHAALTSPIVDSEPIPTDTDAVLRQIDKENTGAIARMSDEEIELEKRAILEQLGEGTGELLRRVQEARQRKAEKEKEQAELEERATQEGQERVEGMENGGDAHQTTEREDDHRQRAAIVASPTPHRVSGGLGHKPGVLRVKSLENIGRAVRSPFPATSSTRPSSRTSRRLRFAEVTPDDVHVYESAPVSPKRTPLALPPPPDAKDDTIVSLGTFHKDAVPSKRPHAVDRLTDDRPAWVQNNRGDPEEGTPEYIRRRYFPNVPADDPNLAWMEASSLQTTDPSIPRFDLHGVPIPASLSSSLPSHLGLHHHAEGAHAGYTIDDVFLLARSTVPAQRASMLGILAKIAHRLGRQVRKAVGTSEFVVFAGEESELRKRILAAGLAAIDQIGSLGARAVEVVWECLVGWDDGSSELEGLELALAPDIIASLQLDHLLPQITDALSQVALPSESLVQLLAILHWLARQSNRVADMIIATPRLVRTILGTFLLTPVPPREESVLPNSLALQTLITLASASRSNASALLDPADALLRFVAILPSSSPFPPLLSTTLLTYTLQFYATLASYGFYSHIATRASQIFTDLASYILAGLPPGGSENASDLASRQLRTDWASLIQAWIVCATDPHATTPPHEILWSQVCAFGWATDMRKLRQGLGSETSDWPLYVAIWNAESAWLEGARVNGIKGGEDEREEALQTFRNTFSTNEGVDVRIVRLALGAVQRHLEGGGRTTIQDAERLFRLLGDACNVLASALRLWLACLPPLNDGTPPPSPPFQLPFSELSALSATLAKNSIWTLPSTLEAMHLQVNLRPVTSFVVYFHRVSRHIPGTKPQLWFAQALVFLPCLLPGDESYAIQMLDTFSLVTPQFVGIDPTRLPRSVRMDVLRPFFEYAIWPEKDIYIAPLSPTRVSISRCTTLRLPSPQTHGPGSSGDHGTDGQQAHMFSAGLPLTRDFLFAPLTHLLRSGASPVFRALPDKWTASEVEVVRAMLLLVCAARRAMVVHGLEGLVHGAAEAVFACMRVCMLEHGVGIVGAGGTDVEVFRDADVEWLMRWLLEPWTVRGLQRQPQSHSQGPTPSAANALEDASAPYLGPTPFYQFYTDLVALYNAVSFGDHTFAALVIAPLAMRYAVDYRRALWCGGDSAGPADADAGIGAGLGDVVRSVRLPIEDVVCTSAEGPREYLYPIERDVGVLGAYVAALVALDAGGVEGFLRLVAVHHVACTVWADLRTGADGAGEGEVKEEVKVGVLRAVLVRGGADVVKDVVLYRQRRGPQGAFVWPPSCYRGGEDEEQGGATPRWREERLAFVTQAMGEGAAERVRALLTGSMSTV